MSPEFDLSIFTFRRDLRLEDNTALIRALKRSKNVVPLFIFDPTLMEKENRNTNAIQFMIESLSELDKELRDQGSKLYTCYGQPKTVIQQWLSHFSVDAVFANEDYSPYAKKRANRLQASSIEHKFKYIETRDYLLTNPRAIFTGSGDRYQVFTYFYKKAKEREVEQIETNTNTNYFSESTKLDNEGLLESLTPKPNPDIFEKGGRKRGLELLQQLEKVSNYAKTRDYPSQESSTRLSPHHKFGTISIRETYFRLKELFGRDHDLIRQLYWRDFYTYLAIHYDHVFEKPFKKKYRRIIWENDPEKFKAWKEGKTGFPIVDAGMRQLNTTGFMHNRIRMIVASFLVKDLHIDWRWGEKYFAEKLVDYDIMVNNGNWQWAASTGADAQPYFRIFNPWAQQRKYDPNTEYIKEFIPELQDQPSSAIHNLAKQRPLGLDNYPRPIVEHKPRANKAKSFFKNIG